LSFSGIDIVQINGCPFISLGLGFKATIHLTVYACHTYHRELQEDVIGYGK